MSIDHRHLREELEGFDSAQLNGIKNTPYPIMAQMAYRQGCWHQPSVGALDNISLSPMARIFHYGQSVFEGFKAMRQSDGSVKAFRPDAHYERMRSSCEFMLMPIPDKGIFLSLVDEFIAIISDFVPEGEGRCAYIRPVVFATAANIDIDPSDECLLLLMAIPFGGVFRDLSLKVYVNEEYPRAFPGGSGAVKVGGNYALALRSYRRAKALDCHQTLWLDALTQTNIEELSGMNFFAVIDGEVHTPPLSDTILPGVTRDSVLKVAASLGIVVCERAIPIAQLLSDLDSGRCQECFVSGTAAGILPVGSLVRASGVATPVGQQSMGPITERLKRCLVDWQRGQWYP
jgi:branched-chain amino acid aminotransferase